MSDQTTPPSGTDIVSLGLSVDATQPQQAADALDKLAVATVGAAAGLDTLNESADKNKALSAASAANTTSQTQALQGMKQAQASLNEEQKAALAVQASVTERQQGFLVKLHELIDTFGLSREEMLRLQAAQINLSTTAEPLIQQYAKLRQEQEQSQITQKRDIDLYRERSAAQAAAAADYEKFWQTELAASEKAAAERVKIEQARDVQLNAMRQAEAAAVEKAVAQQVADEEAAAAAQKAIEEKRDVELNAMRQKEAADYIKFWETELAAQEAALAKEVANAEKAALAEAQWTTWSVNRKIAELERLKAYQTNPNISPATIEAAINPGAFADLAKYEEAVAAANAGQKLAKASANEFAKEIENVGKVSGRAVNEIGVLTHEVLQGRFSKMLGSFAVLAQYLGFNEALFTGVGAAALSTAAALGVVTVALVKGSEEQEKFNAALAFTGNYAATTYDGLRQMAAGATSIIGTIGQAKDAVLELAASGAFTSAEMEKITKAAVSMEALGGQAATKTITQFEGLSKAAESSSKNHDAVTKAALKMDEQYHVLNATIVQQISSLEEQGHAQEALRVATDTFADTTIQRSQEMVTHLGYVSQAWHGIKADVSSAIDAVMQWGAAETPGMRLASAQTKVKQLETFGNGDFSLFGQDSALTKAKRELTAAQDDYNHSTLRAVELGMQTQAMTEGARAAEQIASLNMRIKKKDLSAVNDELERYHTELQKLKSDPTVTQNDPRLDPANIAKMEAGIRLLYSHKGAADSIAGAELQSIVQPSTKDIEAQAKAVQQGEALLKKQYDNGEIGLQDYFDAEQKLRDDAKAKTLQDYIDIATAGDKYIATVKDQAKKIRGQTLLKTEGEKKQEYDATTDNAQKLADENKIKLTRQYSNEVDKLTIELDKLTGDFSGAAEAQIHLSLQLEKDKAFANHRQDVLDTIAAIEKYKIAVGKIQSIDFKVALSNQNEKTSEGQVGLNQTKGYTDEISALLQIRDLRQGQLEDLNKLAAAKTAAANDSGNAKLIADAAAFRLQIDQMSEAADVFAIKINDTLQGPLNTFFDDFITRSKTVGQAARDMVNSVVKDIDQIVSKELTNQILQTGAGGSGGFGAFISSLFGKGAGASAVAGTAGAAAQTSAQAAATSALAAFGAAAGTSTATLTTMGASTAAADAAIQALATAAASAAEALATVSATSGINGTSSGAGLLGLGGGGGYGSWGVNNAGVAQSTGLSLDDLAGAFAEGGDPPVDAPSMVGEKGPEIFVPKTAGTIINNQNIKNMLSNKNNEPSVQVTQNVHFTVSGPITRETQAQIATATYQAASRATRRNG